MYVILSYDAAAKRDVKIMKICRRYLHHNLRSVFDGVLSESKLRDLKHELEAVINPEEDKLCIYECTSLRYSAKEYLGIEEVWEENIL